MLAVAVLLLLAGAPPGALAGEYQLTSDCIDGAPGQLFVATNSDTGSFTTTQTCPTSGGEGSGLHVGEVQGAVSPYIADGAHAEYTFTTVPGTTITAISYRRYYGQFGGDGDTIPALRDAAGAIIGSEWCKTMLGSDTCSGGFDSVAVFPTAINGLSTSSLSFGLRCVAQAPATVCGSSGPANEAAWFTVYSAVLTIDETTQPTLGPTSGTITSGGWLRGTTTLSLASATDPSGIQSASVSIDGASPIAPTSGAAPTCDFGKPKPCSDLAGTSWAIDTTRLADGQHTATVGATNAAGSSASSSPVGFRVDNTAPTGPLDLTSSVGTGWQTSDGTLLTWTLPDQGSGSPITAALVATCDAAGQDCGPATPTDTLTSTLVHPGRGAHVERVWLGDAAGNIAPESAATVPFRYAATPPPAPTSISSSAATWQSSRTIRVAWTPPPRTPDDPPLTRGEVQICAQDGSACTPAQVVGVDGGVVDLPHEGALVVRAWDVDEAGLGDAAHAATAPVYYSATPPRTVLGASPAARSTSRRFRVTFRSEGGPAPVSTTAWQLCQHGRCPLAGQTSSTTVAGTVPTTGTWTLTLTPIDAAGVRGTPTSVSFVVLERRAPRLLVSAAARHGQLTIATRADPRIGGTASVVIRCRSGRRLRIMRRMVRLRRGAGRIVVTLPAATTAARVVVRYGGSTAFRPGRASVSIRMRPVSKLQLLSARFFARLPPGSLGA